VSDAPKPILALVRDLMFVSKITAVARSTGVPVRVIRHPASLPNDASPLLIVDLNQDGTLPAAISWKQATGGPVIGFVSHVDGATIKAARAAGIDRVMPRSEFDRRLPELLAPPAA
jgi:hypothetical protein